MKKTIAILLSLVMALSLLSALRTDRRARGDRSPHRRSNRSADRRSSRAADDFR